MCTNHVPDCIAITTTLYFNYCKRCIGCLELGCILFLLYSILYGQSVLSCATNNVLLHFHFVLNHSATEKVQDFDTQLDKEAIDTFHLSNHKRVECHTKYNPKQLKDVYIQNSIHSAVSRLSPDLESFTKYCLPCQRCIIIFSCIAW